MVRTGIRLAAAMAILMTAACNSNDSNDSSRSSESKGSTIGVAVDGRVSGLAASFNAYFPSTVSAHPGDTVKFTSTFTGAPHTVTFGTVVDTALKAADTAGQNAPELKLVPSFNPPTPGDPIPVAAEPCATDDAPPLTGECGTSRELPDFTGKQAYFNSGWLADKETFSLKLAGDIAPGSYRYFCLIHRLNMEGTLTVVDADTKLPTGAEVKKTAEDELNTLAQGLKDAVASAQPPAGANVQAGVGSATIKNASADEFAPKQVSATVNTPVVWSVRGRHTISFNPPAAAHLALKRGDDGVVKANTAATAPAGGPGQTAGATAIDGGTWDGTGYHSSGGIAAQQAPVTYSLTFTKAGTYSYECVLHPGMTGTVNVT